MALLSPKTKHLIAQTDPNLYNVYTHTDNGCDNYDIHISREAFYNICVTEIEAFVGEKKKINKMETENFVSFRLV